MTVEHEFQVQTHAGNPQMARVTNLDIKTLPACEGGGWYTDVRTAQVIAGAMNREEAGASGRYADVDVPPVITELTIADLASLVKTMRDQQKRYFKTRDTAALNTSKLMERTVDDACEKLLSPQKELL